MNISSQSYYTLKLASNRTSSNNIAHPFIVNMHLNNFYLLSKMKNAQRLILLLICTFLFSGCATTTTVCDTECQAEDRRHAYILANSELQAKHKKAILLGRVSLGMSKEDVTAALGPPKKMVDTNAFWVEREQWVYEFPRKTEFYYFKFGQLNRWNILPGKKAVK